MSRTQEGRKQPEHTSGKRRGRSVGPIPDKILLHGREDFVESLSSKLSEGSSILLEGLAGIGKTTVAVSTAEYLIEDGWIVRWENGQSDSDPRSIAGSWFGGRTPSTKDAIAARADSKKTLLVLDEAQQLSGRHSNSIQEMLEACSETSAAVLVVTRAPNPFTEMSGFESIRLEGLEPSMARSCSQKNWTKKKRWRYALPWTGTPLESSSGHPTMISREQEPSRSTSSPRFSVDLLRRAPHHWTSSHYPPCPWKSKRC